MVMLTEQTRREWNLIHTYTVQDMLDDGEAVSMMDDPETAKVAKEHFRYPVIVTREVYSIMTKAVENQKWLNDYSGILSDMLFISKTFYDKIDESSRYFRVIITGASKKKYYYLKMSVQASDPSGNPIIIISLHNED